jgi:hypothetical protein
MKTISVTLTDEICLEQALLDEGIENPAAVTKLIIAGTFTKDDFAYIRENMTETLQELDMDGTSVVEIDDYAFLRLRRFDCRRASRVGG